MKNIGKKANKVTAVLMTGTLFIIFVVCVLGLFAGLAHLLHVYG